jgi:alanine-synthesizing transaminase
VGRAERGPAATRGSVSGRVPENFEPNPLSALLTRKRAEGRRILDLTVTNPTTVGLAVEEVEIAPRAETAYAPDPSGSAPARRALAGYYAEREGRAGVISPERLVLTASTSESYAHLFRLLCDPGDDVLVPAPSYPLFEPLARLEGVGIREYELSHGSTGSGVRGAEGQGRHRWRVEAGALEAAAGPRTRAVLLVQPNNPTGSLVDADELASIEAFARRRGLPLVSDEVFGDFPWPPATRPLQSLLSESRAVPTFVLGGISKLCGLPQMKLGWIAVTGPEREVERALEGLEWIADLFLSVSAPIEAALPELLARRRPFREAVGARLAANLGLLRRAASAGGAFRLLEAQGGWSAILCQAGEDAAEREVEGDLAERILERHDVLLHPGHFYGLSDRHLVLSLIVEPPVLQEALARFGASP